MIRMPIQDVSRTQGFTLIEMSVVIAIIGILIGGVIGGQYMIKQAELQTIITDFNKYKSAYVQFKTQYAGPPGDISDATDYWGKDNAVCSGATGTASTPGTCPGDGDGTLDITGDTAEIWRAWQQLSLAGLVDGYFSGVVYGSTRGSLPGTNVPAGKRSGTGTSLYWLPTITGTTYNEYVGDYGTVLHFGKTVANEITNGAALTPREALQLDAKIDDGKPATGKVFTDAATSSSCVSSQTRTAVSATYSLTNKGIYCNLGLKID